MHLFKYKNIIIEIVIIDPAEFYQMEINEIAVGVAGTFLVGTAILCPKNGRQNETLVFLHKMLYTLPLTQQIYATFFPKMAANMAAICKTSNTVLVRAA